MTYYYNGIKVRTSNNYYAYGVYYGGRIIAFCGRYDLALKRFTQEYNYRQRQFKNYKTYNAEIAKELEERLKSLAIVELEVRA